MKSVLIIVLLFSSITIPVFAQSDQILITFSDKMNDVIFDGKWTFFNEWKASSLNEIGSLKIRSAHQGDFVYFMLNFISDTSYNKNSDRSVICFDTKNNQSTSPDNDDFCFVAIMGKQNGFILQGGGPFASTNYLRNIPNHDEFIAIGSFSDDNDRYSKTPHATYEFKIPTQIIERSNEYGLYIEVFDANKGEKITWPQSNENSYFNYKIFPKSWGKLISIDNSLPEFPTPLLVFSILLATILILQVKSKFINIYHQ